MQLNRYREIIYIKGEKVKEGDTIIESAAPRISSWCGVVLLIFTYGKKTERTERYGMI